VVSQPVQSDYNTGTKTLSANADVIYVAGQVVKIWMKDINDKFKDITTAWDSLQVGWTGKSKEEADTFNARVKSVIGDFFGLGHQDPAQPNNPNAIIVDQEGIMPRFASGLMTAGSIYGQSEINIYYSFRWFADMLNNPDFFPTQSDIRPNAQVTPPDKNAAKDLNAPTVTETAAGAEKPWFKVGDTVQGDWSWTQDNPDDPNTLWEIDVKSGSVWTGHEGNGVTIKVVPKDPPK